MIMPGSYITAEYEFTVKKAGKGLINFYPDFQRDLMMSKPAYYIYYDAVL